MQFVQLHYENPPACDFRTVKARAQEILEAKLGSSNPDDVDKVFLILHLEHAVKYSGGEEVPAQTAIITAKDAMEPDDHRKEIQQSWRCTNAEQLLRQSSGSLLVTEMMARSCHPYDRVSMFHGVLRSMIELTNPIALLFKHSQQVVKPVDYMASLAEDPIKRPGSLNVRLFRIENSDGDMVMDTRGLDEIGLHDLQCHFRGLDPKKVAAVLYNTALYVFENGPIIESGQTVAGIEPDSKWRCQFENALIEPKRELLDLDPGRPYAAGKRRGA